MTQYQAFRRQPVPGQVAQQLQTTTLPAPVRGLVLSENYTFMQPGGALQLDNWKPTLRGLALRGGCIRWNDLHALDAPAWLNSYLYSVGDQIYDSVSGSFWQCALAHTSANVPTTFTQDYAAHPVYWTNADAAFPRLPVTSAFEYISGTSQHMYAANHTKLWEVTGTGTPTLIQSGQTDGNYTASQLANQGGDYIIAVNDSGDFPLRFDGTSWIQLNADQINGPVGTTVEHGRNLVHVWKYRNRWFFIEGGSMNAWYLSTNAIQGTLQMLPISGANTVGGKLMFGATWTVSAGDGLDDKCVFVTDQGEAVVFTGTDPSDANNWAQQARYHLSPPMGKNAHLLLSGDLLILTTDGIASMNAAMTKDAGQLELAMITQPIRQMWQTEAVAKNNVPWDVERWDEYGAIFITWPGGVPGNRYCAVVNNATNAWCRYVGWDAMCWIRLRGDMFFGTQKGTIMQADRTGKDDGQPYTAIMVGGWEMFQAPSETVTWRQSRVSFIAKSGEPFKPYVTSCTDYNITVPTPPSPAIDPGPEDLWDEGLWDQALWDHPSNRPTTVQNTGWVSVGQTGYSHAPVIQVVVAQQANPQVEMISLAATFDKLGVNV